MTMIEVLVALLLLSIGLLAMAGIQANSSRIQRTNEFRGAANELLQSFAEAVRANPSGAIAGNYNFNDTGTAEPARPATLCQDVAVACTAATIAQADLFQIRQAIRRRLPEGNLFATYVAPAPGVNPTTSMSVWVYWTAQTESGNAPDDALWAGLEDNCPAQVAQLTPRRICVMHTISL
ncbi:type IV pilus modification protein PilV [Aquabacterium lacunae]|nr:type IV pilus modification protein PilV [Aquabacterium lacunae]